MTTIAFIGLGIMGEPMAGHLVAAGHDVIGVNRSPDAVDRLVARGAPPPGPPPPGPPPGPRGGSRFCPPPRRGGRAGR
ncbi:MAG: NAD(P)-binding domain-containing protein, partial [Pseudonocardia sp.]|nr:NAD(P)-binding domain-containing protein [Pseudonocardia sp.]